MPLHDNAAQIIRANLEAIKEGKKARAISIGRLTEKQLAAINAERAECNFPPIVSEVLFIGKHIYQSRCLGDGYTVEDIIQQIMSAMHENSVVQATPKMTALVSQIPRRDAYGNRVIDRAVFECTSKHPRPELFSVIPIGDKIKPWPLK